LFRSCPPSRAHSKESSPEQGHEPNTTQSTPPSSTWWSHRLHPPRPWAEASKRKHTIPLEQVEGWLPVDGSAYAPWRLSTFPATCHHRSDPTCASHHAAPCRFLAHGTAFTPCCTVAASVRHHAKGEAKGSTRHMSTKTPPAAAVSALPLTPPLSPPACLHPLLLRPPWFHS
jgi:hypothetical protein